MGRLMTAAAQPLEGSRVARIIQGMGMEPYGKAKSVSKKVPLHHHGVYKRMLVDRTQILLTQPGPSSGVRTRLWVPLLPQMKSRMLETIQMLSVSNMRR